MPVLAADASAGVAWPGLLSEPRGSVKATSVELDLAGDAAVLRLKLGALNQARVLKLQGPAFTWLGEAEPYPDRHFPELEARPQGTVMALGQAFKAMAGNQDVTADVRALGLPRESMALRPLR